MTQFIKHLPCPRCNSKDNLAEYDDHFFCFGCKYTKQKNDIKSIRERVDSRKSPSNESQDIRTPTLTYDLPKEAKQWLFSYGITNDEITDSKMGWDVKNKLLILLNMPQYWQGRSFMKGRPKYSSYGKKPLTYYGMSDTIVCVEDVLSAIKIARLSPSYCATPLLGCSMTRDTIQTLSKRFKMVILWLDRDKAKEAIRISREFKQRGIPTRIVISPEDPKEYTKEELTEWLNFKSSMFS